MKQSKTNLTFLCKLDSLIVFYGMFVYICYNINACNMPFKMMGWIDWRAYVSNEIMQWDVGSNWANGIIVSSNPCGDEFSSQGI